MVQQWELDITSLEKFLKFNHVTLENVIIADDMI